MRVLVMGLIGLIPIAGAIAVYGWTLAATDMVRQRWRELPPAGFQYLERGVAPFVVILVYGLTFFVAFLILVGLAVGLSLAKHSLIPLSLGLGVLAVLLLAGWWVFGLYCLTAFLITPDQLGIGAALNPRRVWRLARYNHEVSMRAGLIYLVASIAIASFSVVPFGSLVAMLAVPAVFAVLAPSLAAFSIPTQGEAGHLAPPTVLGV